MKAGFFDHDGPHREASALTAFSHNRLDRSAEHRAEDCAAVALHNRQARLFAFCDGKLVLKHENTVIDPLFAPYELADLDPDFDEAVLLGYLDQGEPRLAVSVRIDAEDPTSPYRLTDGRSLIREHALPPELLGEFAQAASLIRWNADNRFCGRCGGRMEIRIGGYRRQCAACGHALFPRTDPVVIMLALDVAGDRCLLGRSHHFSAGMYSCLAGFVEPGETVEDAVRRETAEESGLAIGRVRYHASQPWPMPHQLMIACYAEALTLDIRRDEAELEDCRWFGRDEVKALLEASPSDGGLFAPPEGAIAHRLMRDWLEWPSGS